MSYLSASTPARSSRPSAERPAIVDEEAPCQVEEDRREDHGATACLLEKMGDGRPSCEINERFELETQGLGWRVKLVQTPHQNRNSGEGD